MEKYTQEELNKAMDKHEAWRRRDPNGKYLKLHDVDLSGLDLSNRDLSYVELTGCDLRKANFENTNLSFAILKKNKIRGANFKNSCRMRTSLDPDKKAERLAGIAGVIFILGSLVFYMYTVIHLCLVYQNGR
ncbi:MAG: pentapeptide repeat-containing protein [Alphaproteobacteria bacterium]|jgi:hypothetical protein|nr:pentapeptide repeat-containing protein [Alphaproteobacteria bacterium]